MTRDTHTCLPQDDQADQAARSKQLEEQRELYTWSYEVRTDPSAVSIVKVGKVVRRVWYWRVETDPAGYVLPGILHAVVPTE